MLRNGDIYDTLWFQFFARQREQLTSEVKIYCINTEEMKMRYGVWINWTVMYFNADGIRRSVLRSTHREMTFIPHWIEFSGWETVSIKVNLFVNSWALAYFSRTILLQLNLMEISPAMRRYMSASSRWRWWTRSKTWIIWRIQLMLQEI